MHNCIVLLLITVSTIIFATIASSLNRRYAGKTALIVGSFSSTSTSSTTGVITNRTRTAPYYLPKKRRMSTTTVDQAFGNDTQHLKRVETDSDTVFEVLEGLTDRKNVFIIAKATWCPDCQAVPSMITGLKSFAIEKQSEFTVVLCDVGSRELWKSGTHPLKSSTGDAPSLHLAGVPMLIQFADGKEKGRLTAGLTDGAAMQQGEAVVAKTVTDWLATLVMV